jgi:hypothetical protein
MVYAAFRRFTLENPNLPSGPHLTLFHKLLHAVDGAARYWPYRHDPWLQFPLPPLQTARQHSLENGTFAPGCSPNVEKHILFQLSFITDRSKFKKFVSM